jgi:ABC-2 type transport system ATP-binding protein
MATHTSGPAVSVTGLTKRYGDHWALDGVDLTVEEGECVALLGPNGAGKTTTVEILEGYRKRTAGAVAVLGEDPGRAGQAWRARIGVVLQDATDQGALTVGEVVSHFARYYPASRDPGEVIDAVGLAAKRGVRVGALSGGQRRRLDVALGIVGRPALLFLDEPTTGFDPEARRQFWELIAELRQDGTTVLLTTHYLDEAEHLADRVTVVVAGRVAAAGTPAELRRGPTVVSWSDGGGRRHRAETSVPTRLVAELAEAFGGEVPELAVERPTLEDAYLHLLETAVPAGREGAAA